MRLKFYFFAIIVLFWSIESIAQTPCSTLGTSWRESTFISVTKTGTSTYILSGDTSVYSGISYDWQKSFDNLTFTSVSGSSIYPSITITLLPTDKFYFRLAVYCGVSGFVQYSCSVYIPIDSCSVPTITIVKSPTCPTDTLNLLSSISASCNRFQWEDSLSGTIAGATSPNLKILPPITSPNSYRLKYICPYGTTYSSWLRVAPITSCDTAKVSISKTTGCAGDTLKLKGTGISPCATLQWEDSLSGAIAVATKDSLIVIGATSKTSYRLKSTCPLGKVSYSNWVGFNPIACDSPIVTIAAIGGCTGDTIHLAASGISPCAKLQWEDSLSGTILGATDSVLKILAGTSRNAFRLKTTCPLGKVFYSDWFGFTPYATCDDSVWAGDVNWDLIVDYLDLLDLGVAYGTTGYARSISSISWAAQYCKNWTSFFPTTVNYKNADCDGNGVVNDDDTLAITTNYSSIHSIGVIKPKHTKITGVPDLYFDLSGLAPKAGDIISIPIKFGTASIPVPLIYGIATQIYVDGVPPLITPMSIDYSSSWISIPKFKLDLLNSPNSNQLDAVYVRKDNNNNAGYGTIGMLTLQVPSSTADKTMMHLSFLSAKVIDKLGNELTNYNILDDSIMISASTGINEVNSNNFKLYIYPNPSDGKITITESINTFKNATVKIYDLLGREVYQAPIEFKNNSSALNIDVVKGTYILTLQDEFGNSHQERIVIQ